LERLRKSRFEPVAFELSFGEFGAAEGEGGLPPLLIPLPPDLAQGAGLSPDQPALARLRGRIDRLDGRPDASGIQQALVIDYKQGKLRRSLDADLAMGLNLQVAIYLLATRELLGQQPVAGLYYSFGPSPRPPGGSPDLINPLGFRMRGLMLKEALEEVDPRRAFLGKKFKPLGESIEQMEELLERVRRQVQQLAAGILSGQIRPLPAQTTGPLPCQFCSYRPICRFDQLRHRVRTEASR
jgi:ATP-dependent helicase/nuclease subunit B